MCVTVAINDREAFEFCPGDTDCDSDREFEMRHGLNFCSGEIHYGPKIGERDSMIMVFPSFSKYDNGLSV